MPAPNPLRGEQQHTPYEIMLRECLRGELRVVNAGLPRARKRLPDLLCEEYPHVICHDGSTLLFKRKELEYLASMLSADEQEGLFLPILISLGETQDQAAAIYAGEAEEKVLSQTLNMPLTCEKGKVTLYKPQLALLRKKLKTTTQYVFSHKILQ